MARGRMLSKSLSTSKRYAALYSQELGEFCQSLYPLLLAHADDYGRLEGDAFTVKHSVIPASARTEGDIEEALQLLHNVHLIEWYQTPAGRFIQIIKFAQHQAGLKKRSASACPEPPERAGREAAHGCELDASEDDIEAWLATQLKAKRLEVPGFSIVTVERQVRRGSSYFDILATTEEGPLILIEVKRQRITDAALQQVLRYQLQLGKKDVIPILVGHGIASGANVLTRKAVIAVYDDRKKLSVLASYRVKSRDYVLRIVPSELKGTEQKGSTSSAAEPALAEPSAERPDENFSVIEKLAHTSIDVLGVSDIGDLVEDTKRRCAEAHIAYSGAVVTKAVDSAVHQRGLR